MWRDVAGTGSLARLLLAAGAPVNGGPGDPETPLITAASYGDAEVARVLVDAGADLETRAAADAGGVPGGTALLHAAVFGMTEVLDLLVAADAVVDGVEQAAAVGNLEGRLTDETPAGARLRALVMATDHQRLEIIDQLVDAGTPVDGVDSFGRHPLRTAAENGRHLSVQRLLEHGADPTLPDRGGQTPLNLALRGRDQVQDPSRHDLVVAVLSGPPPSLSLTGNDEQDRG